MAQQEIDQVEVIASDDFRSRGELVKKDSPFKCTKGTAKQLVATGKARWPEKEAKPDDEGDGKKAPAANAKKEPAKEPAKS
ncbi:hypothetical protein K4A83_11170 [Spirulina subsalsa FACHB-351]|uniref:Uncharacterized protein n=1 Tax=Spirulina subsalsa FACHB-351 TaxID=234711 RepID=A0ABT3L5P9_9CYAN|nr:hypothetical protein [Spirulina subsalsa]MCW6036818.1 hypothetical protein [Spirulina subsalsa FACHB-351]